ncbi:putative ankyrin repeat protein RF_0381 [Hydra vulgaris]|uniref:putative ankyrin repeat protein RF_0381 n=1 Tax=Hydra vulgaris TaxID=6087 RepID=UPI0002B40F28|nr:putative ankyrin repeat protein RF_0381 [Hydra vulgaris]
MAKSPFTMLLSQKFSIQRDEAKLLKINDKSINKYKSTQIFIDESIGKKLPASDKSFLLHQAAIEGCLEKIQSIFYNFEEHERKKIISSKNFEGCTPLHLASKFNKVNIIIYLLDNGSEINEKSKKEKNTALLIAAKYNMTDAANYLCERGANVNLKNSRGLTALHFAARKGNEVLCTALMNYGCDVNSADDGEVLLNIA